MLFDDKKERNHNFQIFVISFQTFRKRWITILQPNQLVTFQHFQHFIILMFAFFQSLSFTSAQKDVSIFIYCARTIFSPCWHGVPMVNFFLIYVFQKCLHFLFLVTNVWFFLKYLENLSAFSIKNVVNQNLLRSHFPIPFLHPTKTRQRKFPTVHQLWWILNFKSSRTTPYPS